ncbi:MAG: DUF2029 domain-containing protein [Chloroflexi bacterium]|nr:DUF2029 domain-containing protein [Chloroflexota bacterium]
MAPPRRLGVLLGALVLLYLALTCAFYVGVASQVPGANDFYSRWMGARALFLRGQNPYSHEVTQDIQIGMYGRLARPDEDQVAFAYPLYAAFFALPFITLSYAWAESFWIALLVLVVLNAGVALARFFAWRFTPPKLLVLILFVLAFYPVLRGLFLGQFTLLVFASMAFGLVLLARHNDEWAGWVLAISTVKPHIAVVALTTIFVWVIAQRRWRVLRGFVSAMAVLGVAATILLPSWFGDFVGAVNAYAGYIQVGPPFQVLSEMFLPLAWTTPFFIGGTILLFGMLVYRIVKTFRRDVMSFIPTIELAMLVTTMTMVRTATTDQTLLLIPWVHWLGVLMQRGWQGRTWLLAGAVIIVPWVVFLSTLIGNQEAPIATTTVATMTLIAYGIAYWRDQG